MAEDILRSEILEEIAREDEEVKILGYVAKFQRTFVLCPLFLGKVDELPDLEWQTVDYDPDLFDLPDEQGVYAFSITAKNSMNLPNNSYILYIGKAGDLDSDNTIQKRYRNYVTDSGLKDRHRIRAMVKLFGGHLKYHYSITPDNISTGLIEKQLTKVFIPPFNVSDFDTDLKGLLKGVGIL